MPANFLHNLVPEAFADIVGVPGRSEAVCGCPLDLCEVGAVAGSKGHGGIQSENC